MEAVIIKIFESALSGVIEPNIALLCIIVVMVFGIYKFVLIPMKKKVVDMPSSESVKDIVNDTTSAEIEKLNGKIDILIKRMETLETHNETSEKDCDEIKRDLENIKQILNQFHGHMLYNNQAAFGNRELK